MLMNIVEVREDGITVQGNLYKDFNNIYGIAHGGYLYGVAHIASQMTGDLCLGGQWDVAGAECLYLHPLRVYPSVTRTVWINKEEARPMLCARVYDNQGALCFEMNRTLKPAEEHKGQIVHTPHYNTQLLPPKSPYDELKVPCLSSTFSRWLNIYTTKKEEASVIYSVDLNEKIVTITAMCIRPLCLRRQIVQQVDVCFILIKSVPLQFLQIFIIFHQAAVDPYMQCRVL